jgi:hypothetical protein
MKIYVVKQEIPLQKWKQIMVIETRPTQSSNNYRGSSSSPLGGTNFRRNQSEFHECRGVSGWFAF